MIKERGKDMRLRNLKNTKEILENSAYFVKHPENYKSNIQDLFPKKQSIHIEIGMGKGNFITTMAQKHPNINYIGIEKFDKVLARALLKIPENLSNLKVYRCDAIQIADLFENEVEKIYLNFSDPWPKKRQAKHRLTSPSFLKQYDKIFQKTQEIEMKTDNVSLFLYSLETLSQHGYQLYEISLDYQKDLKIDTAISEYEQKFVEKGIPICHVRAIKRS